MLDVVRSLDTRIATSIADIDRDEWDQCFPGEPEAYDYLLTVETAGISGFEWCYATVYEGGHLVAAMPAFITRYALDTTLEAGRVRAVIGRLRRIFPRFLTLPLACLGSPCTETGNLGFHASVRPDRHEMLFEAMLSGFEDYARKRKCVLGALKDIPQPVEAGIDRVIKDHGYAPLGGMPTAWLAIDFNDMDSYFARLSSSTRKDMRRKLRAREKVRVEYHTQFGDHLPRIMQLYNETRTRSEWQFEELTPAYFEGILKTMPGRSFCTLYFVGDELLAANLMVHNDHTLIDKFFCMDETAGRPYNLYYLSWFENIGYCLKNGLTRYQSGQAYYTNKVRLGSRLTPNEMYFRHRNPVVQRLLRMVAPYFAADEASGVQLGEGEA
ncbi:GNAT family N-acetyltransferase [Agrobacterium vitis]|uniref:GNAT family N-acetyltransferase n=1 Tax=Agrobacterium vitis TaxID=373 RepID=UPI0012E9615E|nr:GNAT family N-acetyltransferase [Agrobacterium vitis]MVA77988.1 GNAT family N-acetyltransferase [Agrobacterium vitis]